MPSPTPRQNNLSDLPTEKFAQECRKLEKAGKKIEAMWKREQATKKSGNTGLPWQAKYRTPVAGEMKRRATNSAQTQK